MLSTIGESDSVKTHLPICHFDGETEVYVSGQYWMVAKYTYVNRISTKTSVAVGGTIVAVILLVVVVIKLLQSNSQNKGASTKQNC